MVVDCIQYRIANSRLFRFLEENNYIGMKLQLLLFWGRHPQAKLSLYTIATALDTAKLSLRQAIEALAERGILNEQQDSNGLTTYSLSCDQQIQDYIKELARLDWSEIRIMEKQLQGEAILA